MCSYANHFLVLVGDNAVCECDGLADLTNYTLEEEWLVGWSCIQEVSLNRDWNPCPSLCRIKYREGWRSQAIDPGHQCSSMYLSKPIRKQLRWGVDLVGDISYIAISGILKPSWNLISIDTTNFILVANLNDVHILVELVLVRLWVSQLPMFDLKLKVLFNGSYVNVMFLLLRFGPHFDL